MAAVIWEKSQGKMAEVHSLTVTRWSDTTWQLVLACFPSLWYSWAWLPSTTSASSMLRCHSTMVRNWCHVFTDDIAITVDTFFSTASYTLACSVLSYFVSICLIPSIYLHWCVLVVARSLSIVFNVLFTFLVLGKQTSVTTCSTLLIVMLGFYLGTYFSHYKYTNSLSCNHSNLMYHLLYCKCYILSLLCCALGICI